MQITYWGVRGSIPVPGRSTLRFGGNTACVEIRQGNELVILDAGSGIRPLGAALMAGKEPLHAHLLISHTHWDHIQGFPFFAPAYVPGNRITVYGQTMIREGLEGALSGQMDSIFFPVGLDSLGAALEFVDLEPGESTFSIGEIQVSTALLAHPGVCIGYRLQSTGGTVVYVTDWEPLSRYTRSDPSARQLPHPFQATLADRYDEQVTEFCRDADLLICDAQYDCAEYQSRRGWGHCCIEDVVSLALDAGVRQLALFHHDPVHDDNRIRQMERACREQVRVARRRLKVSAAREGEQVTLGTNG